MRRHGHFGIDCMGSIKNLKIPRERYLGHCRKITTFMEILFSMIDHFSPSGLFILFGYPSSELRSEEECLTVF